MTESRSTEETKAAEMADDTDGPEPDEAGLAAESKAIAAEILATARTQAGELLALAERGAAVKPSRLALAVELLTDNPQPHLLHADWASRIDWYHGDAVKAAREQAEG